MTERVTLILVLAALADTVVNAVIAWASDHREEKIEDWSA